MRGLYFNLFQPYVGMPAYFSHFQFYSFWYEMPECLWDWKSSKYIYNIQLYNGYLVFLKNELEEAKRILSDYLK